MSPHASLEEWLAHFGLSRLEAIFRDNGIDLDILASLTDDDLRKLGFSFGDRRRVLTAVLASVAPPASSVPQPAAPAHAEAERRQLTVLFCDLAGSTALSARLDPEDLREVIRAYQETCAAVIGRHDGFVAKFMGDGLLAYFGYPRAHEDEAAHRAGRPDIVASVGGLQTPAREALQVRIGIATGLVVVGDLIGTGAAQEQSVVGETPNLAARLQALAGPNAVVISETTRRQVGGLFDLRDLGVQTLKGFDAAQRAWQVLGESNVASRFEALHPAATALVGRDEEIDLLLRRWARAKDSAGQVVLLSGEPGIGKSRIAAVLQDRLRDEPHMTLRYFSSPRHRDSPLHPFIAHLEEAAGIAREDLPETRLVKLEAQLLQSQESPAETIAVLADLLDLTTKGGHSAPTVEPQRKRELTFAALLQQLDRLSRREPVLMLFEDVHWIDQTSSDLLGKIIEQVPCLRLLLVVTARPEFQAPWSSAAHVSVLALSRLGAREGRALADLVAGSKRLPDEIVAQIVERADGVPLFVEELTKTVLESGLLREQNGRFVSDGALPPLAVPTSLHGSLMARLDRLGPAKQIAQFGAAPRALITSSSTHSSRMRLIRRCCGPAGRSCTRASPKYSKLGTASRRRCWRTISGRLGRRKRPLITGWKPAGVRSGVRAIVKRSHI